MANQSMNNPNNNLYAVGGKVPDSIKPNSQPQIAEVAINSGIVTGGVKAGNDWGIVNDNDYGVNLAKDQKIKKNPVNPTYLN